MAQSFHDFLSTKDTQLQEAFNSAPYELSFGKKNAGDVYFTFVDEDEKEFRIQFYTPQGLGKNVRQVFIGQKRGSTYPDAIARFKNPMRVIASMIEATKQFLATPLGKTIDGFAINFSKKALERGVSLLPKIIRMSGLKQKLNVMDLTYTPIPDRAFVWVVRKGFDPAKVFDGPKMQGITWDDPDKVGDVPVQNNNLNPDEVTDAKWESLVSAMKKTRFGNSVKTLGDTAIGQVIIDGFKIIGGLIRGSESVALNFDAYDSNNKQINLPLSSRRFVDIDVDRPDAFKGVVDLAIDVIMEIVGRENLITGAPRQNSYWTYRLAGNPGQERFPTLEYNDGKSRYNIIGTPSSGKITAFRNGDKFSGTTIDGPLRQIGGSNPPEELKKQFMSDMNISTSVDQNDITEGVVIPRNGKVITKTKSTFTIRWDMGFPPSGPYAGAVLETTVLRVRENDYVISNIASTKNKTLNDLKSYDYRGDINSLLKEEGERYSLANAQLSTLTSISYNPNKLGYDLVSVGSFGEVRFNGQDIGLPSNRQVVINAVMKMNDEYEKNGGGKKTGVDLATYAGSIRDNAPKGRDLDWQIYASRDGKTLNIDWDITFRRNTTEGAFREFKAQIDRANQYLQTLYQDAKSKGYNPTEPNLMTLARAQQSDEFAQSNGESAYSEYEQSLGGNLQIRI